jgi:ribosome-associated translation inhibitor RaiA
MVPTFVKDMKKQIPFYIVGMPDRGESILIASKFYKVLVRLQKVYSKIVEARITIEKSRTRGKRISFEVRVLIVTPYHKHIYKETGWDLSNVCEQLGQRLLRNLSKRRKNRSRTSVRKIQGKIF